MTDNELAVMIGAMKDVLSILADAYAREDVPYAVRVTMADAWGKLAPFVDMHKEPKA